MFTFKTRWCYFKGHVSLRQGIYTRWVFLKETVPETLKQIRFAATLSSTLSEEEAMENVLASSRWSLVFFNLLPPVSNDNMAIDTSYFNTLCELAASGSATDWDVGTESWGFSPYSSDTCWHTQAEEDTGQKEDYT